MGAFMHDGAGQPKDGPKPSRHEAGAHADAASEHCEQDCKLIQVPHPGSSRCGCYTGQDTLRISNEPRTYPLQSTAWPRGPKHSDRQGKSALPDPGSLPVGRLARSRPGNLQCNTSAIPIREPSALTGLPGKVAEGIRGHQASLNSSHSLCNAQGEFQFQKSISERRVAIPVRTLSLGTSICKLQALPALIKDKHGHQN